jgi:hypothetical protein
LILDTKLSEKYFSLYVGRSQMPRGKPKKQPVEVELLPPDENDQIKVREVKHKTEWVELRPVEEAPEEDEEGFDGDSIENRPRRKVKDEHTKLRELLAQHNIAPAAQLRLSIERYLHSESSEGGSWADKEFLTRYICTKEQIVNEDYLDVARKWGAGTYWFTLRMYMPGKSPGSKVVASWEKRLGPTTPNIQHVNPNDPTSPQVVYQSANGDGQAQQVPMSIKDIMKTQREALKEQLEMAKLMREAYGFAPEQPQQQQRSEEEILSSAILKQPEVIETVVGSVIKRFGGSDGKDNEPWYADVVRDAVKSGQAAQIVQVAIDRIFNGFGSFFPGRQNNGQAEMATAPVSHVQHAGSQVQNPEARTQALEGNQQGDEPRALSDHQSEIPNQAGTEQITPEQHALARLIQNCQRNVPVQVAFQQLVNYADAINEQAPDYSIDGYIDLLGAMETEQVLEFVKTLPGGEQVAALPHAKEWTAELQKLIKESQEEESE